jgi:hypothetical protein
VRAAVTTVPIAKSCIMEATDELAAEYDSVKEPQLLGNYSWTNAPITRSLGICARHAFLKNISNTTLCKHCVLQSIVYAQQSKTP